MTRSIMTTPLAPVINPFPRSLPNIRWVTNCVLGNIKRYVLFTLQELFVACQQHRHPHYYEVIDEQEPVAMYFDIERNIRRYEADELDLHLPRGVSVEHFNRVNESPFTLSQVQAMGRLICRTLMQLLVRAFPRAMINDQNIQILSSSKPTKLSLHVIFRSLTLDHNTTSCAAVAWEATHAIEAAIQRNLASSIVGSFGHNCLLRLVNISLDAPQRGGIIDLSVYSRNQCFRLLGNAKIDGVPLRLCTFFSATDRATDSVWHFMSPLDEWLFTDIVPSVEVLASTLTMGWQVFEVCFPLFLLS